MKISEFSRMTGLSIKALRLYETKSILLPCRLETSRYRYYSEDQIILAKEIFTLRLTGFSIREIKALLPYRNKNEEGMLTILEQQLSKTEDTVRTLNQQRSELKNMIEQIKNNSNSPLKGMGKLLAKGLVCKRISESIKDLSEVEIREKTRLIPNSEYLRTVAMVDDLARTKLLSILSDKAIKMVKDDLEKLDRKYSGFWR